MGPTTPDLIAFPNGYDLIVIKHNHHKFSYIPKNLICMSNMCQNVASRFSNPTRQVWRSQQNEKP